MKWPSTATYAVPASKFDGSIFVIDAPGRHARDVLRHVVPLAAGIARVPDLAVVGAGPDQPLLHRRRRNREHELAGELAEVVADDAAGRNDAARDPGSRDPG